MAVYERFYVCFGFNLCESITCQPVSQQDMAAYHDTVVLAKWVCFIEAVHAALTLGTLPQDCKQSAGTEYCTAYRSYGRLHQGCIYVHNQLRIEVGCTEMFTELHCCCHDGLAFGTQDP